MLVSIFHDILVECFRNINMEIKEGSLIAVVGKVILIEDQTN